MRRWQSTLAALWVMGLIGCDDATSGPGLAGENAMDAAGGATSAPADTGALAGGATGTPADPGAQAGGATGTPAETSGQAGGATQAAGGEEPASGSFELAWEDDFDTVDLTRWQLMTHSWDSNLAQFGADNASATDGILSISLSAAEDDSVKPYRGVEMRSRETLTYGKIEASVRFAAGSAVISSLVLIYTPWPPPDWNELDIEFLGKNTDRIQCNHMVNIPPADPATGHLQFPEIVSLYFNPAEDFHTYAIEWVPNEARFFVDGELLHTATKEMARMVLPQNILLTIWASNSVGWAGPVDETTAAASAEYDWIKVYRYVEE